MIKNIIKKISSIISIQFLIIFLLVFFSLVSISNFTNHKTDKAWISTISASGKTEWFYIDHHNLDIDTFGTPDDPRGLDTIIETNRKVIDDQYIGLRDGMIFSRDRADTTGSIYVQLTDLTNLDQHNSKDKAELEANFLDPDGNEFKVVLHRLLPEEVPLQTFGGVGVNHFIHGNSGIGTTQLFSEFSYGTIFGLSHVYKNNKLIAKDVFTYMAVSQRSRGLNEDLNAGLYDFDKPTGKTIVHLVLLPLTIDDNQKSLKTFNIPTGFIGKDGLEQNFFHINYYDNIVVTNNHLFK